MAEEGKKDMLEVLGAGPMMERPDYIPESDEGAEHITKDDITIPRIAIAQGLSPQIIEGDPKYIDGLKFGDIFNNLTSQIYGKGPIEFFIIRGDAPRGVEFIPLKEGGGIRDFDVPLDDPRMEFTTGPDGERKKPIATKFYDFIVVLLASKEMVALSFKSTGLKVAKDLNSFIKLRRAPIYTGKYVMSSVTYKDGDRTWAQFKIENAGWLTKEQVEGAKNLHHTWKDRAVQIERDQSDEEEAVREPVDTDNLPVNPPF